MNETQISQELDQLYLARKRLDEVIGEIKAAAPSLFFEYALAKQRIEELEKSIREKARLAAPETIRGQYIQLVYNKGRVTWNEDGLYHLAFKYKVPIVLLELYRSEGDGYWSIRNRARK